MKKPSKKEAKPDKKPELSDFLKAKQERQKNNPFQGGFSKGGQAMKPRMWNRKNGM